MYGLPCNLRIEKAYGLLVGNNAVKNGRRNATAAVDEVAKHLTIMELHDYEAGFHRIQFSQDVRLEFVIGEQGVKTGLETGGVALLFVVLVVFQEGVALRRA